MTLSVPARSNALPLEGELLGRRPSRGKWTGDARAVSKQLGSFWSTAGARRAWISTAEGGCDMTGVTGRHAMRYLKIRSCVRRIDSSRSAMRMYGRSCAVSEAWRKVIEHIVVRSPRPSNAASNGNLGPDMLGNGRAAALRSACCNAYRTNWSGPDAGSRSGSTHEKTVDTPQRARSVAKRSASGDMAVMTALRNVHMAWRHRTTS
jgi:hypothetical protein